MPKTRTVLIVVLLALVYIPFICLLTGLAWLYYNNGNLLHAIVTFVFAVVTLLIFVDHALYVRAASARTQSAVGERNMTFRA